MSEEYLEIVRRGIEAFNRGDLAAALQDAHPELEWHPYLSPEGKAARGPAEVRRMWEELRSVFGGFHWQVEEILDTGDAVIALGALRGVAPGGTEREVAAPIAQVYWIEDGLLRAVRWYRSKEQALEAAELLPAEAAHREQHT